ncbi:MAG: glycoside hydrolase family 5 protein [Defluviitaleaceae bacterium]|nr:glycoside hydrolase family 5 protein [Defluviitaleaceae bacterium]MCL2240752.1 glycoside hydrolase family 5 protein [Defluviitaleaceae bacterium]
MTAMEYVRNLGFGWNLGDTMDARVKEEERENLTPRKQETAWFNPETTFEIIKKVADSGFTLFRLPVTWTDFVGPAPDYTIRQDFLGRVAEIVSFGLENGMTVILNLHHEDWHFPSHENYPAASEKLMAVWTQIAEHFKPCCNKLIFEAMNEPRKVGTDVEWNGGDTEGREVVAKLGHDFIRAVRATGGNNAQRMLMVPLYAASSDEEAMGGYIPSGDDRVIVSIHSYTPYNFALSDDYSHHEWTPALEDEIDALFARIDKYFLSKNIPVIMGEMGARRKGDNLADRVAWTQYYAAAARKYGVPCIWWDNGRIEGPDNWEKFGLLERGKLAWAFPELVVAFLDLHQPAQKINAGHIVDAIDRIFSIASVMNNN